MTLAQSAPEPYRRGPLTGLSDLFWRRPKLLVFLLLVPPLAAPIFATLADRKIDMNELVRDDTALADHIRDNVAGTFHPVGTCRMSADASDRDAVTDTQGRVRGFEGLRVVDASLMPTVPRGNTNIPTIMLAEKISASIATGQG